MLLYVQTWVLIELTFFNRFPGITVVQMTIQNSVDHEGRSQLSDNQHGFSQEEME